MSLTYIRNKLRSISLPLQLIDESLPRRGTIVDLGCGEGVIAHYLAQNRMRKIIGIDKNVKRLPKYSTSNLQFRLDDISNLDIKNIHGAIISDVLHHINFRKQPSIIENIFNHMKVDGILIIKEIDKEEAIRSILSRLWDLILYPKEKIYFSKSSDLMIQIKKAGFRVTIKRPCRLFPGSTTLYICKK